MNKIDFTQPDGFPLKAETLGFMQEAYQQALYGLAQLAGVGNIIVSGCTDNGSTVTSGWIYINNELFYFQGGTKSTYIIVDETITTDTNQGGATVNRYFYRSLKFGTSTTQFDFSSLERVESLSGLRTKLWLSYFESAIILSGCSVSNVSGGNLTISSGVAMLDNQFINVPSYNGAYPVYFGLGVWSTTAPGGGSYLTFNPHTGSRLQHIYKRAVTIQGEIIMQAVDITRFDNTGLGKWEYAGFALCNGANGTIDLRGRVPLGYDPRTSDPSNGIWDTGYNALGNTGGEKKHVLSIAEMPRHNHQDVGNPAGSKYQASTPGDYGLIRKSTTGQVNTAAGVDNNGSGTEPVVNETPVNIPWQGDGVAHENRQPFIVLAYIQRI